jgi:hypothetical protein
VTGSFLPCAGDVENHLFPDIVADQPAEPVHAIFGGVPRPTPRGVLDSSPYAYLEAVSLVRAEMADRVNARLKDEFGSRFLRVRGALKAKCHLMFGIVALAVDQLIRVVDLRPAPA